MHRSLFLAALALALPASLAEELNADDVPSACTTICQPIVDLSATCDIDPNKEEADDDNEEAGGKLRFRRSEENEEKIEADCICTNKSFDVASVLALCASCISQNSNSTEDVDRIMSQCSFSSTSYVAAATSIVRGVQVDATKPAVIGAYETTTSDGSVSLDDATDSSADLRASLIMTVAGTALVVLLQM